MVPVLVAPKDLLFDAWSDLPPAHVLKSLRRDRDRRRCVGRPDPHAGEVVAQYPLGPSRVDVHDLSICSTGSGPDGDKALPFGGFPRHGDSALFNAEANHGAV